MEKRNKEVVVTVDTLEELLESPTHQQRLLVQSLKNEAGYNSWPNYETYRTRRYLEEQEDLKEAFIAKGRQFLEKHTQQTPHSAVSPHEKTRFDLAEELRGYFTFLREMYVLDSNTAALLHGAYLMVDYEAISEDLLRDAG